MWDIVIPYAIGIAAIAAGTLILRRGAPRLARSLAWILCASLGFLVIGSTLLFTWLGADPRDVLAIWSTAMPIIGLLAFAKMTFMAVFRFGVWFGIGQREP